MKTNILYYLSHPYTTHGDPEKNRENAINIECFLTNDLDIIVINPIAMPLGTDNDVAMGKCRHLYNACDSIIFCDDWDKSVGCREEYKWAVEDNKPKYRYRDGKLLEMDAYQEYLDSVLDPRD